MPKRLYLFPNLEAELVRAKVTRAELSAVLNISRVSLNYKMAGRGEFKLEEMERARSFLEQINATSYELGYLFARDPKLK